MQAIIQILKVNDLKTGVSSKTNRPYEIQDAECLLLNDDGTPSQIGVLSIPKDLRGKVQPGTYTGSFSLRPDLQTRRIEAVLVGLNTYATRNSVAPKAA
jgi:hypothetical protein